ncbi:MAG: hypothetical protein NZ954_04725 [Thermofilaceae archaeon]|nr:hypothetical protein [Thermofilaceae archaeon]MDW8004234.1 hypothetical protein [Thermofilaceae archaeon]
MGKLCGRPVCPILKRFMDSAKVSSRLGKREIQTATPPSVLVGEHGYPTVGLGPIAAPEAGGVCLPLRRLQKLVGKAEPRGDNLLKGLHGVLPFLCKCQGG